MLFSHAFKTMSFLIKRWFQRTQIQDIVDDWNLIDHEDRDDQSSVYTMEPFTIEESPPSINILAKLKERELAHLKDRRRRFTFTKNIPPYIKPC